MRDTEEMKPEETDLMASFDVHDSRESSTVIWEPFCQKVEYYVSKRRFLGKCVLAGLVISTVLSFVIPPRFEATVMLMPPNSTSLASLSARLGMIGMSGSIAGSGAGSSLASGAIGDLLGLKSPGQLFVQAMNTDTVENRIIDQFKLLDVYKRKYYVDARKKLEERTTINEDRKSGIISISVSDQDAKRAADIANAYARELDNLLTDIGATAAGREREFLRTRVEASKRDLDEASRALSEFSSKNSTLNLDAQVKSMVDAGAQLEGQIIAARSQLHGLQQLYTDNNQRVMQAKAALVELESQLRQFAGSNKPMTPPTAADGLYPPIRKLPLLGVEYVNLYRRVKIRESLYVALTQAYEMEMLDEYRDVDNVRVLESAKVPEKKAGPNRLQIVLGGVLFFVTCGMAWMWAQSWWKLLDEEDPRRRLLLPGIERIACIGSRIPFVSHLLRAE